MPEAQVTVVIPCFNQGQFLAECLQSLRDQTVQNWCAIVLNDASTDGVTPALCDTFADDRVQVLHMPQNLGRALVRNVGIAAAQTEGVLNLDADDKLAPTYLEKTLPLLLSAPEVGVVYTDYQKFDRETGVMHYEAFDQAALYWRQFIPAGALFRRSAWAKTTGYHADFSSGNEDYDIWLRIVEAGYRGIWLPEPLYLYRIHQASWSSSPGTDANFRTRLLLLQHHKQAFQQHHATQDFLRDTYVREARRLRGIGQRMAARKMYLKALQFRPLAPEALLGTIWP